MQNQVFIFAARLIWSAMALFIMLYCAKKMLRPRFISARGHIISAFAALCLLFMPFSIVGKDKNSPQAGAESTDEYISMLSGKRVALAAHHASTIHDRRLLDVLLDSGIQVVKVFAPEHGFSGRHGAGELIPNNTASNDIPIISLYNDIKKPDAKALADVDIIVFDMQDVGVRCYTYLSTLHYIMEAAAETKTPLIILDRPNPNGHFVDGPMMKRQFFSFIGMHSIPLVHGMTLGELAMYINGEKLLAGGLNCLLTIIKCRNYTHKTRYILPIAPSPNLPNMLAVYLYPSLVLFEGTIMSVGRGTDLAFQLIGHPKWRAHNFTFTPKKNAANKQPLFLNKKCRGLDLSKLSEHEMFLSSQIDLNYLIDAYKFFKKGFFNSTFNYLAGNAELKAQIEQGMSADAIRKTWQSGIIKFKETRKKYLLYHDFEE